MSSTSLQQLCFRDLGACFPCLILLCCSAELNEGAISHLLLCLIIHIFIYILGFRSLSWIILGVFSMEVGKEINKGNLHGEPILTELKGLQALTEVSSSSFYSSTIFALQHSWTRTNGNIQSAFLVLCCPWGVKDNYLSCQSKNAPDNLRKTLFKDIAIGKRKKTI